MSLNIKAQSYRSFILQAQGWGSDSSSLRDKGLKTTKPRGRISSQSEDSTLSLKTELQYDNGIISYKLHCLISYLFMKLIVTVVLNGIISYKLHYLISYLFMKLIVTVVLNILCQINQSSESIIFLLVQNFGGYDRICLSHKIHGNLLTKSRT